MAKGNRCSRWRLRQVPALLADRYKVQGFWDDVTLGAMVAQGLAGKGDVGFHVHSRQRPWHGTLADADRAARALAGSLSARGVAAGDVVVIQLPNWFEAGVAFWSAAYLGAVVVPIVHFYGKKEINYILRATAPDVVISADRFGRADHLAVYRELLSRESGPLWLVVGDTPERELPPNATPFASMLDAAPMGAAAATVDPDAPAIVAFTSGTTRDPKGVIHSHRTIVCETRQLVARMQRGGPPPITGAPVGHFIGMLSAFLAPLLLDRSVHLVDLWEPREILRLMREHRLGMGGGATYFLTSLLDHPDFSDEHLALMPVAGLGGSPVPVAVTERATRLGIKVFRAYGSTEHPSITSGVLDDPEKKRLSTDGRPCSGVELRIDEHGEILSRGPDCFVGYTDSRLTDAAFDEEGWYRTGDIGVVDDDGYLTIVDRKSDVIIRGGENISAQEVEELLLGMKAFAEVNVVAALDERFGERAAAVVRLRDGIAAPTLNEVRAHLEAAGLARQKWPESLHVVTDFPRTASGKVQKFVLRQQIRDGTLSASLTVRGGSRSSR
jgi:acyl-CoA synthetase